MTVAKLSGTLVLIWLFAAPAHADPAFDALVAAYPDFLAGHDGKDLIWKDGTRMPLLVVSPLAKNNYVDHTLTDQSSILKFVEDNWGLPRIPGSFDGTAGSLNSMFDFGTGRPTNPTLFLDPVTGGRLEPGQLSR